MSSIRKSLRDWFGYSRRERRSTFILLIIMAAVAGARYLMPFHGNALREIPIDFFQDDTEDLPSMIQDRKEDREYENPLQRSVIQILELNSCDSSSLDALPGIGPVLSSRIIKYRDLLGGFVSKEQLKEVYGLSGETFVLISQFVRTDSLLISKIRINEADYRQLIRHPYFSREEVNAIIAYRKVSGIIENIGSMVENGLIPRENAEKIAPYLEF